MCGPLAIASISILDEVLVGESISRLLIANFSKLLPRSGHYLLSPNQPFAAKYQLSLVRFVLTRLNRFLSFAESISHHACRELSLMPTSERILLYTAMEKSELGCIDRFTLIINGTFCGPSPFLWRSDNCGRKNQ